MAYPIDRPNPPVLKRDGFQICQDRFGVANVNRITGSRLSELFNPGSLRLKRDQKAAEDEGRGLFKKAFFAAHLRYYAISFASSARVAELEVLLRNAVREGKCDQVPASVRRLEQSMRREYEPLLREWEKDVRLWESRKKQHDDAAFAKCTTPGQRASTDLDRFMAYYFLTDGRPDPAKTPEPLALIEFSDRSRLHCMAEHIPGLHTVSGGSDRQRTLCIGWDRLAVWRLATVFEGQAAMAEQERREAAWAEDMRAHERYLSHAAADEPPHNKGSGAETVGSDSFDLGRCCGSFLVRCDAVTDGWSEDVTGKLGLDIRSGKDGTLVACFNFGIVEGTMLLSLSEDKLDALVGSEAGSDSFGESGLSEDDDDDDEDDDESEEDTDNDPKASCTKRLARSSAARTRAEQDAGRDAKRPRLTPCLSRRVYYRLRGRDTGSGEILPRAESGQLDFLNDRCATFAGLADNMPCVGRKVEFLGYKVSDTPRARPEAWSAFSRSAYEYARVNRWD